MERQALTPLTPLILMLSLLTGLVLTLPSTLSAQSHQPPSEPPDEWGAISINMEEIEYPYPVAFMNFGVYGQDVRLAYMDVAPVGPANGRTVGLPSRGQLLRLVLEGADRGAHQRRLSGHCEGPAWLG